MTASDQTEDRVRVGVLGLGTMGGRAAAAAAAAGHDVVGFDPVPEVRARAAGEGVRVVDTAEAALDGAEVVLVSVPRPEHVRALADGALRSAAAGTVVVDLSTIDPATARQAAATLAEDGVVYLDCPVLGRPAGCGTWTLVVGGADLDVARVTPLLESTLARRVIRVGDVGAGSVVKILNNLMFGAINAVTAEAVHLCRGAGIDPSLFVDAVLESGAATVSNLFRDIGPRLVAGRDEPVFALDLLAKDNRLALDLAAGAGLEAPVAEAITQVNDRALALGYGSRDSIAVLHAYDGDPA